MKTLRTFALFLLILLLSACADQTKTVYTVVAPASLKPGDAIPAPSGEVILTVSGKISAKNNGDTLQMDLATLEKLGLVEYDIHDPWMKEQVTYTGVLMSDFLKFIQADSTAELVHIVALDDYQVDLSVRELQKWPVLLATRANGAYMTVNENGPTRIIFPFDQYPEIDKKDYQDLSIWNIVSMEVR
ncbi:MAG: molybdopterin-dependent oxidoreductase [Anaerolineales bacterium]